MLQYILKKEYLVIYIFFCSNPEKLCYKMFFFYLL